MKKNSQDTFYITTAIDYATGTPHIGHAYEKIAADIIARFQRLNQKHVFFLTGTDEHGQKVFEKAQENKQDVQAFVDAQSQKFINLTKTLNLSNDFFIRTTQEEHKQFVQNVLQKAYDNNDIYLDNYEGLYCVGCEKYYTENELEEDEICPIHKTKCRSVKQQNYFFKLSKYQDFLLEYYEKHPDFLSPKHRREEIINRVKEGLRDISISRPKESLSWGIEFPFDTSHVTYVWFDALFNYLSATQYEELQEFSNHWPANIHVIGNDISWFHMVYWPAFLKSCGYELPKTVHAHGMVLDKEGHKMSKSLGNVIDPIREIETYGLDEFRYYSMSLGNFGDDCRYSHEEFEQTINNDLNNDLGNLVSRIYTMVQKYCRGNIEPINKTNVEEIDNQLFKKLDIKEEFEQLINTFEIHKAQQLVWSRIRELNAYINETQPFKEEDEMRRNSIVQVLINALYNITPFISIFMPQKSQILANQLGFEIKQNVEFDLLKNEIQLGEKIQLFSKVEQKEETSTEDNQNEIKNLSQNKIIKTDEYRNSIKAIIFDFDGVLVDNYKEVYNANNQAYDLTEEKFKDLFDGNAITGFKEQFEENKIKQFYKILDEATKEMKIEKKVKKEVLELSKNYQLFCVTSNIKKNIELIIKNSKLNDDIFENILCGEFNSCKEQKIRHILKEEYNLNQDEVVFVTDTLGDLKEANRAGVRTIAVDFGFHEKKRLKQGAPYTIVSSFKQIRREIDTLEKFTYQELDIIYEENGKELIIKSHLIKQHPTRENKKVALFVHGFMGSSKGCEFDEWKYYLLREGLDVLSFDFLGCGESSSYSLSISHQELELKYIIEILTDQLGYEEITLIGHSLGGYLTLNSTQQQIIQKIVVAPLTHPRKKEELFKILQLSQEQIEQLKEEGKVNYYNEKNKSVHNINKKIIGEYSQVSTKKLLKIANKQQIPILLLQGGHDKLVLQEESEIFAQGINSSIIQYVFHEDGTHGFQYNTHEVNSFFYSHIQEFLKKGIVKPEPQFQDLRLQLGTIIEVEDHPRADKLYIEKVDFGEDGVKQIVSGLKQYFSKDEMRNKQVLAVTNIQSTQFRGVESQGMLLLAENEQGILSFINTSNKVENGSVIAIQKDGELVVANSTISISAEEFFKYSIKTSNQGVEITIDNNDYICFEQESGQKLVSETQVYGKVR
ncbi:MAG: methionine--tRNA ligase [Candidatus Nanoarchaeia archaeon]